MSLRVRKTLFREGSFATIKHSANLAGTLVLYRLYGFSGRFFSSVGLEPGTGLACVRQKIVRCF